jgi:protein-L-isoaspartate(D-aspartate) O-methyltransferase
MSAMTTELFEDMRHAMVVSQLRPDGVTDARVIEAMAVVPREDYVPKERRSTAYADRLIPLGNGRGINPPMVTGRLLSEARIVAGEHVLIVGSATGYTAAVVAMLTDSVTIADAGETIKGTYDVIMIDGAVEHIPDTLIDHLAAGGRMVAGIVELGVTRLAIGRRGGSGFGLSAFMDAEMIVLPEFSRPPAFVF